MTDVTWRSDDTIAAISSAVGPAARMIVRLSGPDAWAISAALCSITPAVGARQVVITFAGLRFPAWACLFKSPRSYSGQDMAELHVPGNPLLVRMLLAEILNRGARPAEAGEFTARAYFNGRMDLAAAEGVAATIAAHGEQELIAARQLMAGELARRLHPILDQLTETLALVEVGIDFSEEDVTFISPKDLAAKAAEIDGELNRLLSESTRFERLAHEPLFVLVGRPNAGKSTLLNALARAQRAVVSPVAGTTRDVIWAEVPLEQAWVRLADAAGLEEHAPPAGPSPQARIARQMHEHALAAVEQADFVMLVHDATDPRPLLHPPRPADLLVHTKTDLLGQPPAALPAPALAVSAKTGANVDQLKQRMSDLAFGAGRGAAPALALNARHLRAIEDARTALSRARTAAGIEGPEVVALELREALDSLGTILGQVTPDDVLGRVFGMFCIGK